MKITSTRIIYVQPVLFKTISFHHQSEYFIQFEVNYKQGTKGVQKGYPSLVSCQANESYNRKKLVKVKNQSKIQSEKFLIMFNDQAIVLKGGCNFLVETDRLMKGGQNTQNKTDVWLGVSLWRVHSKKSSGNQPGQKKVESLQKVGEQIICINLNVEKDYSQYSSYRHIVFTADQYFSSLLFYIDSVHLGLNIRLLNSMSLSEFSQLSDKQRQQKQKDLQKLSQKQDLSTLRHLLEFKQLRKLHKLLVQDRITEFDRILKVYKDAIKTRLEYINNYEIEEPENIESMDFGRKELGSDSQYVVGSLEYLKGGEGRIDNGFFMDCYETDDADEVYNCMYQESKVISLNIRKAWQRTVQIKLKTLPQQFQTYALKFKLDRMTHITKFYSYVDEMIYPNQQQTVQRIKNHEQERTKICQSSRFYNRNELKHSMLTFHSEKPESRTVISNSQQKKQYQVLVVLVHGFQGSQRDMAKIKSFINTFTGINFLPLQTLSKEPNVDIMQLGKKGAKQIREYLQKKTYIASINVIGFSMGGIIAKAILMNLEDHKSKFNLFMTLSSPHLGISEIENCLVATGVMWMKKVSKMKNIKQLCCQPLNKKSNQITLLSLSQQPVLSWFSHVVLIGSNEDTYVPKYSSLLAYDGDNELVRKIQQNTLKNIKSLDRITAWFEYEEGFFDSLTGRKGHISFIEDQTFLEYVITKYLQFF